MSKEPVTRAQWEYVERAWKEANNHAQELQAELAELRRQVANYKRGMEDLTANHTASLREVLVRETALGLQLIAAQQERDTAIAERDQLRQDCAPWIEHLAARARGRVKLACEDQRWCTMAAELAEARQQGKGLTQQNTLLRGAVGIAKRAFFNQAEMGIIAPQHKEETLRLAEQMHAALATPEVQQSEPTCTNCHRYPATGKCSDCGVPLCPRCRMLTHDPDGAVAYLCDSCYQERINKVQEALP